MSPLLPPFPVRADKKQPPPGTMIVQAKVSLRGVSGTSSLERAHGRTDAPGIRKATPLLVSNYIESSGPVKACQTSVPCPWRLLPGPLGRLAGVFVVEDDAEGIEVGAGVV